MNRKISTRLERVEQHIGTAPDLGAEAGRHGTRLWSVPGRRCYGQDTQGGARLAVVGPGGTLAYEVVGVPLAELL